MASDIETKKIQEQIDKNIIIGITEFDTINPIMSKSQDIQYISKLIYKPLIDITENFKLTNGLAEEWNKLDNKTYLIKLKENEYWNDGRKVTSNDIKYTIDYIRENLGIYSNNVKNINNVDIIDNLRFKIKLNEEEENFEYMLCFPIICEKTNVGTGKFIIKKIEGNQLILESKDKEKQLTIKTYNDMTQLYNAFLNKDVDLIITSNNNYKNYIGEIGYKKQIICGREFEYIKFNLQNKIMGNKEVVQAILHSINKNEIINRIYNNLYLQAEFPLQYGSYLYSNDIEYEYNINKAQKILEDNDWVYNGKNWIKKGQALKLQLVSNKDKIDEANIIKKNLKLLGIEVTVKETNNPEKYINDSNYAMILLEKTASIKPELEQYLEYDLENSLMEEETYKNFYKQLNNNPTFMGLYFNSIILLQSEDLRGNFRGNWFNVFYNIDTWYKIS